MNDGKQLEQIATLIEGARLPPGFKIERNERSYDDDGNQKAELDILITGKVGTTEVRRMIECRDRPSKGAAPREWIQQLMGRRTDLGVHSVIAVSSTGFAPGVADLAKAQNIDLRTFETLTAEDVAGAIPATAPATFQRRHIIAVRAEIWSPDHEGEERRSTLNTLEKNVRHRASGECVSLIDICLSYIHSQAVSEEMLSINQDAIATVPIPASATGQFDVPVNQLCYGIKSLECEVRLNHTPSSMPLAKVGTYIDEDSKRLVDVACWKGNDSDQIKEIWFLGWRKEQPDGDAPAQADPPPQ